MSYIEIDTKRAEGYNLVQDERGRWMSRPQLTEIYDVGTDTRILYCTLLRSGSGENYYYLWTLTSDNLLKCSIRDQNFYSIGSVTLGVCLDPDAPITHAYNYNQVVFNSPGWTSPYYCFIGSTPKVAEKVEASPINPDFPALNLFPGLVASFKDRFVYAYKHLVHINDPGVEPRTLTANNTISCKGAVLDIFEDRTGSLVIITTNNVMVVPSDGLAGAYFQGSIVYNNNYNGRKYRNAVSNRYGLWGLEKNGIVNINSGEVIKIKSFDRIRKITAQVGLGRSTDVRAGEIFSFDEGVIVSFGAGLPFCVINMAKNYTSWWDGDTMTGAIVSVGNTSDGLLMITTTDGVRVLYGDNVNATMGLACEVALNGIKSAVIREIIVTCTGTGSGTVRTAIRGNDGSVSDITTYSPIAQGSKGIQNNAIWGSAKMVASEFASATHKRAIRGDGAFFEVGISKNTTIQSIAIKIDGQGQIRDREGQQFIGVNPE